MEITKTTEERIVIVCHKDEREEALKVAQGYDRVERLGPIGDGTPRYKIIATRVINAKSESVTILPNDERDDEGFQRFGYRVFWNGQWHYPSSLAIDNATACRETKAWLDERNLIAEGWCRNAIFDIIEVD